LLQGEESGVLSDYLNVTVSGSDTTITVDVDGTSGSTLMVVVEGTDLTGGSTDQAAILNQLLSDGNLIVDQ